MSATQISPEVVASPEASTGAANRWRNGVLCAVLVAACLWIAWPVSRMGFVDDWSYARTAQVFAQTGHFAYNGFATAMLGSQIVWGAMFIKVFGFSFTILRVSMLPLAMASVFLFHDILRGFGVNPRNAVIGTLTLGLSPLFMPLADSFMTDIPGLLVILICLYCCQRAVVSSRARTAILWLMAAGATSVVGGTVRQIVWLGALVMVPSAAWMLRRKRGIVPACALLWLASLAGVLLIMSWFAHQPYSLQEFLLAPILYNGLKSLVQIPGDIIASLFLSLLILYPIVVAWVGKVRQLRRASLPKYLLLVGACVLMQFTGQRSLPWLGHVLVTEFAGHRTAALCVAEFDSFLLPFWARALVGAAVIATGLLLAIDLRQAARSMPAQSPRTMADRPWLILLAPYTVAYFLLLCPRAALGGLLDRYLLGVLPVFIVWLLLFFQCRRGPELPRSSVAILIVFAGLGIAGTHDWFAFQRARNVAIDEVLASGVSRDRIQAGVEYDGWTQLLYGGYVNSRLMRQPGLFHEPAAASRIPPACQSDFFDAASAIDPEFSVGFDPQTCFAPTAYPPVRFTKWLPPFRQTVTVQRNIPQ